MKRVFTLFCALVLLLSCFSGVAVSAAEMETAPVTEVIEQTPDAEAPAEETAAEETPVTEELPAEEDSAAEETLVMAEAVVPELFPDLREDESKPMALAAALEYELSDAFMDYLAQEFTKCSEKFNIEKYNIYRSQWADLTSVIWYETPELFHVYSLNYDYYTSSGKIANIYVSYRSHCNTAAQYKECLNRMVANAEYLLRGVKGNNALSNVEKALILHDRLAVWTEYDLDNVRYKDAELKIYAAYSALGEGLSVCQGYALAYMYLLEQVGIESDLCSSKALNHAWNIVYIDGQPYYTDVTWDDPTNNWPTEKYYDNYGRVKHTNFLRSYSGIYSNHTASDYPVVSAPTTYDSGWWWAKSNTSIELFGDQMYYVDNTDGSIYLQNDSGDVKVYQHSNASNGAWVRLSLAGYKLIIGDVWDIKTLDLSNGQVTQILKPSECDNGGYIEGVKYEDGMLYFQLRYNNVSYRYSYSAFKANCTIIGQPKDALVGNGSTAKFTVQAVGDGLTYAWYGKKAGETTFTQVSNQYTDTLSLKMTAAWDGAVFYCVVTDTYGTVVRSNTVTLTMGNFAAITTQPKNAAAPNGKTATLTLKASGDGLTYAWYYMKAGASGYTKSGNQTTNTLSVKMSKDWNGAKFYCVVTDQYGNFVKSSVVKLSLTPAVTIKTQPTNAAAPKGKTAKVTLKATGDGLKYTWYYMKKGASKYTKDSSQKSTTFSVKMSSSWNGTKVYCVISDQYGNSVKTNVATLYMGTPVKITTQPKNTSMVEGKTLKLTLKASGKSLKYTWYYMKKGATKYTKDSSQKSTTFSVKMSSSWDGAKVYCVVTDKYGVAVKSSVVTLKKAAAAKITQQPAGATVVKNTKVKVTVKATGDGLKYQWYYAKKGSSKFKKISSAKSASYSLKMTASTNGRKVYCVVTDKYGVSVKSKTVTLNTFDTVKAVSGTWKGVHQVWPDGSRQSISKITIQITSKGKVTLKAPASGTGYNSGTYTYTLKFVKLSGNTATYRFTNKTETLTVSYSISTDQLRIYLGSGYTQVYEPK